MNRYNKVCRLIKMMYTNIFDTHSHYDDQWFDKDREALLSSLPDKGIVNAVTCGVDIATSKANQTLAHAYGYIYFAAGFHPENLEGFTLDDLSQIETLAADNKCVAIGEIGLDYHWMASPKEKQQDFFRAQMALANRLKLPVIIHDREAHGDTLALVKEMKPQGVLHCFSGSAEMAKEIIRLGMYIGLNGVTTFKNARKSLEVVKAIPLERLVLETDCPYLCPEPYRGRRNDSSYIPFIAERIGEVLGIAPQRLLDITAENARRLYNL